MNINGLSLTSSMPGEHILKLYDREGKEYEFHLSSAQLQRIAHLSVKMIWQNYQLVSLD